MKKYVVNRQLVKDTGHGIQGVALSDDIQKFDTYDELKAFWNELKTINCKDIETHKEYCSYIGFIEFNGEYVGELYHSITEVA